MDSDFLILNEFKALNLSLRSFQKRKFILCSLRLLLINVDKFVYVSRPPAINNMAEPLVKFPNGAPKALKKRSLFYSVCVSIK